VEPDRNVHSLVHVKEARDVAGHPRVCENETEGRTGRRRKRPHARKGIPKLGRPLWKPTERCISPRLASARNGVKATRSTVRCLPTISIDPTTTWAVRWRTKSPLSTTEGPVSAKRSEERGRLHRRPGRSWFGRATSHGIKPRSQDRTSSFANAQSLDLSRSGIQQYVCGFIPGNPSDHISARHRPPHQF
jgi:hypothetical protein